MLRFLSDEIRDSTQNPSTTDYLAEATPFDSTVRGVKFGPSKRNSIHHPTYTVIGCTNRSVCSADDYSRALIMQCLELVRPA